MKLRNILLIAALLLVAVFVLCSCTEVKVGLTVNIEDKNGAGTVVFDLPVGSDTVSEGYVPNGADGLKTAVEAVLASYNLPHTSEVGPAVEGDDSKIINHVYITFPFANIAEYNTIMHTLAGDESLPQSTFARDEATGNYVFTEHSTLFTQVVINLRQAICDVDDNVLLAPQGQTARTADEGANSFYEYVVIGGEKSDAFKHNQYRNKDIGHQYFSFGANLDVTPICIQTVNPNGESAALGAEGYWYNPICSDGELPADAKTELLNFSVDCAFVENNNAPDDRCYITIYTGDYNVRLKFQRRSMGKTDGTARLQVGVRTGLARGKDNEAAFWHNDISDYHFRFTVVATYDAEGNKTTITSSIIDLDQIVDDEPVVLRTWENIYDGKLEKQLTEIHFWAETNAKVDGRNEDGTTTSATPSTRFAGFYFENFKLNGELDKQLNKADNWTFQGKGESATDYSDEFAIHTYGDYAMTSTVTCGQDGAYTRTCSICQATQIKAVKATGDHQYGEPVVLTPAGCLTKGTVEETCSVCGDVYTHSVKATGHTEAAEYTIDVQPTTTTVGSKSKHCTACNAIIEDTVEEVPVKTEEATTTEAGNNTTKAEEKPAKAGCGSTLGVSALALVLVSTLGMGLKRKH